MNSIPERPDVPKMLLGTQIKVYNFLVCHDIQFFNYESKYLYFWRSYDSCIEGVSIQYIIKNTTCQQLVAYSNTCNSDILSLENKQLIVMSKYFGNIIDRCIPILAINGKLLCELIIAHNITSINYNTLIQLPLIFNSQFINYIVKMEKSKYKRYRKGREVNCHNNCGNRIYIQIQEILSEPPVCCKCKTPTRPCVECTNYLSIKTCSCGRFFHRDPDYKGKWQMCEKCRRH